MHRHQSILELYLANLAFGYEEFTYEELYQADIAFSEAKRNEKRGIRKHEEYRLRAKRSNHHLAKWAKENGNKRALGIHYGTPALCSCPMCGNPRKWFKDRTVAEKRFYQRERTQGLREE